MSKLFKRVSGITLGLALCFGFSFSCSNKQSSSQMARAAETSYSKTITTSGNTSFDVDGLFTLSFVKGSGQNAPTTGVRIYANKNAAGNEIHIDSKDSSKANYITGISINGSTPSSKGNIHFTFTSGTTTANSTDGIFPHTASWDSSLHLTSVVATAHGASGSASQMNVSSVTVNYVKVTSDKTISNFITDPDDGETVNLLGASSSYVTSSVLYEISYSDNTKGYDIEISCNQSGFSVEDDKAGEAILKFRNNDDYEVTFGADSNHFAIVTYHVTGLTSTKFELVKSNSKLKAGSQIIITKLDGSLVMGSYAGGNNIPAEVLSLDGDDFYYDYSVPAGATIFTLGGSNGAWTLENNDGKFLHDPNTNNKNYLYIDNVEDTWSINVTNEGVATIKNVSSNKYVKNNGSMFSAYTSGQNDISIFMIPSTDPYIGVEVKNGSTSIGVEETLTLEASLVNTSGTVNWALVENTPSDSGNVAQIVTDGNEVTITGKKDGTVKVRASYTGCEDVDTLITVTKALSFITVTTAPTKTTYSEGELFSTDGMVVTATYDDGSTSTPNDFVYYPNVALTPFDTAITVSYNGKSTTQEITVNSKTVSNIDIKLLPLKTVYHADDEFDPFGLEITVTYSDSDTADINSGFEISPSVYTFTSADEVLGSKTFTVTYGGKSITFDVSVHSVTGPIEDGRYYIMHIGSEGVDYGVSNLWNNAATKPDAIDLSETNTLGCFSFSLGDDDNKYVVKADDTHYLYTTDANTGLHIGDTSGTWTVSKISSTENDYEYYTMMFNDTSRYLTSFKNSTTNDFRSYTYNGSYFGANRSSGGQHARLMLVPEGAYANAIVNAILSNENGKTLCNGGNDAPSTDLWESIEGITHIENELAILRNTDAAIKDAQGNTPDGTDAEKAMARYDEIMMKYNTQSNKPYSDFLGRIEAQNLTLRQSLSNKVLGFDSEDISDSSMIIIFISVLGLSAATGYFFLKKRKATITK